MQSARAHSEVQRRTDCGHEFRLCDQIMFDIIIAEYVYSVYVRQYVLHTRKFILFAEQENE